MPHFPLEIIILAAGKGSRMKSSLPKVLHLLAGRPLLSYVLQTASELSPLCIHIVYGFGGEKIREAFPEEVYEGVSLNWVEQPELLGTGDAVKRVMPFLQKQSAVLVLYGDVPLIALDSLIELRDTAVETGFSLLTAKLANPKGYGRIIRTFDGRMKRIVEDRDANAEEQVIDEINTGFMGFQTTWKLGGWLSQLQNTNAQGEYYLTDVVAMAVAEGIEVATCMPAQEYEIHGINDRQHLARLERIVQKLHAQTLLQAGVTLLDPDRFDLRGNARIGQDVTIDVGVVLEGEVVIGDRVTIGAYSVIKNSSIEVDTVVGSHCIMEGVRVGRQCQVGPFARLRPGSELNAGARIGNFVEVKNSTIGDSSKVNHLSYIGDARLGADVNIGAGTITCNYDGANKHQTVIGDHVFVGSSSQLVAPVNIENGVTIGAGSTITRDVAEGHLVLSRAPQKLIKGWQRPQKNKQEE